MKPSHQRAWQQPSTSTTNKSNKHYNENYDQEVRHFAKSLKRRLNSISNRWDDAKSISIREKISIFSSIMNILITSLLVGFRPQWIPYSYSVQFLYFMPIRIVRYKKILYHYCLLDMCYFINLLCFVFLWILPSSTFLFEATYALSLGPVASAIVVWRNSLVFRSIDKFTTLYIHIYPPLTLTVLRHLYPDANKYYPALSNIQVWKRGQAIVAASIMYLCWQILYYQFITKVRREKIEKGGRVTSFTYMLQYNKGLIGKALANTSPKNREPYFMIGQFVYTEITMLIPVFCLYDSLFLSSAYLILCFAVSAWNGATFEVDIVGKKFEKELNALCKELEELQKSPGLSPAASPAAAQILDSLSFNINSFETMTPSSANTTTTTTSSSSFNEDNDTMVSPLLLPQSMSNLSTFNLNESLKDA